MNKKIKASLAIEATISFTVFLCFMFILISMVKLSMIYITLNDVTSETVKKIAGMSYPISYVNEMIDENVMSLKKKTNLTDMANNSISELSKKTGGATSILQEMGLGININSGIEGILNNINSMKDNLIDSVINKLFDFKNEKQTELAAQIYSELLDATNMPIDKSKVKVKYFTLPQSSTEFNGQKANIMAVTGLEEDKLSKDDVMLVVEYDYQILVPFFPAYDVKLKSMAIERAWLNGGNHVTPSAREGIPLKLEYKVCITISGNGEKYHRYTNGKADCMTMKAAQKNGKVQAMTVEEAKNKGYPPCSVCKP